MISSIRKILIFVFILCQYAVLLSADIGVLIAPSTVRFENNIKSASIDVKAIGSSFRVLKTQKSAVPSRETWLKVQFEDGTIGWVQDSSARTFNAQNVELEKQSSEKNYIAEINELLKSIQTLEANYKSLGLFSVKKREEVMKLISDRQKILNEKLRKATDFLSIDSIEKLAQTFQLPRDKAQKELESLGAFSFKSKNILREYIKETDSHVAALNLAIHNFKAQAFIDFVRAEANLSTSSPNSLLASAKFSAPGEISVPEAEREFKVKYRVYLDLMNKNGAPQSEIEQRRSEYLKAYNIYKELVQNSSEFKDISAAPVKDIKLIVDKTEEMVHIVDANGKFIRSYPMSFGKEAVGQKESENKTFSIASNMKNTWYSPFVPPLLPNLTKNVASRWLGINSPSLAITSSPYIDEFRSRGATGCVRMYTDDAEELSNLIAIGTPVTVKKDRQPGG